MLFVTKTFGMKHTVTTSHHVGEPIMLDGDDVVEVQADGDELMHIFNNFTNIPWPNKSKRVVVWYGDMAKFIVENW